MLKLSDLAQRVDFRLGPLSISPSRRHVEGPAGQAHVEPLVMQVFLLLLHARGKVVTRAELFDQVWGGVIVGDDSLNRAIAGVRRIAADTAPGLFEIETVPRTGYRLTGEIQSHQQALDSIETGQSDRDSGISRRALVGGGMAAVAAAGGLALWYVDAHQDREFDELMALGEQALDFGSPGSNAARYFQRAAAMRPGNAKAQGLFAYSRAMRSDNAEPGGLGTALQEAESASRAALAIDPDEPNALVAQTIIQGATLDFAATEDRLRAVLAIEPANLRAMRRLWGLLQCVGRSRDALALIERAIALKPLAAGNNYPWAQLLWILGRTAEADRVIDKAMQRWPSHHFVRFARFSIFAYTDRPRAALAMLETKETTPQNFSPAAINLWRVSLAALDRRSPESIAAALNASIEAAKRDPSLASQAASVMSALGEIDAAFEIAETHFAIRSPSNLYPQSVVTRPPARSTAWRFAPWLFTPPTAPMRSDPRFKTICDEIGLTDYWSKRGIKPDYQLGIV